MESAAHVIERNSPLWSYLPEEIKGLIVDGEILMVHAAENTEHVSDYSYLVFPFAKAYEGFLKRLFLDLDLIKESEYYGDQIRIGRILNPNFMKSKGNVFSKLCKSQKGEEDLAFALWDAWKVGRNQVFHYFPHNFRHLSYKEALDIIARIANGMQKAVNTCEIPH